MKWMIASDLHGSASACRSLLERFNEEKADRLLLLGDLLYHGPRNDLPREYAPREVIAMLNAVSDRIISVRGNCDAEVDQMVLGFPVLSDYALIDTAGCLILATHGHLPPERLPALHAGEVLLQGHTHIPRCEQRDGVWQFNPGSAAMPKESSAAGYMTLDRGVFVWHSLDGTPYREQCMRAAGR